MRQNAVSRARGKVIVDEERCKACELCIFVCPVKALETSERINSFGYHPVRLKEENNCTGCALCARICPDVALEVFRL